MPTKRASSFPSPLPIASDLWATWRTAALAAASELDVFTALDKGLSTAEEVAAHSNANAGAMRRLLDAMVGMKHLVRRGDRYELALAARTYLSGNSDLRMVGAEQVFRMLQMGWQQLAQVVRTGRSAFGEGGPPPAEFFSVLVKSIFPQNYVGAKSAARAMGPAVRRRIRNILDVGGGAGAWSIAIAEEIAAARATIVDYPEVIAVAREYVNRRGLAERFEYREGNFREVDFGTGEFDLAILGHIVHGEGAEWGRRLIERCAGALRGKGILLIAEFIPNDKRTGPAIPLLFDLNMMIATPEGATFTMREYRQWLKEAGFASVKTVKSAMTPSPLILAVKP